MVFFPEVNVGFYPVAVVVPCLVNFIGHMWPEEVDAQSVVHVTLVVGYRQFWVLREVIELWTKRTWHHSLYRAMKRGGVD